MNTDPRGAARRGADHQDIGYMPDAPCTVHGKQWPAPDNVYRINAYMRQRQATACIACWVLGHTGGAT